MTLYTQGPPTFVTMKREHERVDPFFYVAIKRYYKTAYCLHNLFTRHFVARKGYIVLSC